MYLHLGRDVAVPEREIIGIFDLDTASFGKKTREFLARLEREGRVTGVSEELPKSFILCGGREKISLYISQISAATLLKRAELGPLPDNFIKKQQKSQGQTGPR